MTERIHSLTVVLDHNFREDDAQPTMDAIRQLRGVLTVGINVADPGDYVAQERARYELQDKLREVLWPPTTIQRR